MNVFRYYALESEGKVTRVARLGAAGAYGWEDGKWVSMPGLWKIENDITDYKQISEEEAKKLTEGM